MHVMGSDIGFIFKDLEKVSHFVNLDGEGNFRVADVAFRSRFNFGIEVIQEGCKVIEVDGGVVSGKGEGDSEGS